MEDSENSENSLRGRAYRLQHMRRFASSLPYSRIRSSDYKHLIWKNRSVVSGSLHKRSNEPLMQNWIE